MYRSFKFIPLIFSLIMSSVTLAIAEPGAFRIELREKKAVRETEIIPMADNGADPRKTIKVRVFTNKEVWAFEKSAAAQETLKRELGIWESDILIYPKTPEGLYPVDLIMSLRLASGTIKRVERRLEVANSQALAGEQNALDQLRNDFVDLVRNQYWPADDTLADEFDKVLVSFASKHMRKMLADLPAAFEKQDSETQRRIKLLEQQTAAQQKQKSELETAVEGQFKDIRKENEKVTEETDFIQVEDKRSGQGNYPLSVAPQYTRRISFELSALAQNGVQRFQAAEVHYHVKTIQFDDGQFRTNFRIDFRPMMRERTSISKNFEHAGVFNEKTFLEEWKKVFWQRVNTKVISGGKTEQARAERAYLLGVIEPVIFKEQYAFSEFLAKAKFSFQSRETKKELEKLRRKLDR